MPMLPEDVVDEYAASLIEPDEDERRAILAGIWTDDCEVVLLEGRLQGREEVNAHITRIRQEFGNATPRLTGAFVAHHGFLRFDWQILDPAGDIVARGVNFGEQAEDGRLRRVVVFREGD